MARSDLWEALLPPEARVASDVDFDRLAEDFELSGGNIKNAILRAAYRAAAAQEAITMEHIQDAAEQECRNAGKIFRSVEPTRLGSYL